MTEELYGLLGASNLDAVTINAWFPAWKSAFEAATESSRVDPRIHTVRLNYYEKAIQTMLAGNNPRAALWSLLQTWSFAAEVLPDNAQDAWRSACGHLGLNAVGIEEHVNGLDHFLDEVEGLLDELSAQHGLDTSTSL
jgi:hypothetical protein